MVSDTGSLACRNMVSSLPPSFPIVWRDSSVFYEQARVGRVFNLRRPERFPLAVIHAKEEQHIVEAVRLARQLGCRISVRSGGHSWAVWSVRDDAILLDFGLYHGLSYDDATGVVKVSPSITGRQLNNFLSTKGRMFPGGHCPDVGIGGFALQGGMGWNCKNWGWACERVLGVDVVTADGSRLHCDDKSNADLYFAARGAGPGFPAIVTCFHLQTIPLPACMRSAAYIYKREDYVKALSWISGITSDYDQDTEIVAVSSYPPGAEDIVITLLLLTFKGCEEDARKALQRAEDTHPPGKVGGWFMKQTSLQQEYDEQAFANPKSHRYCADNAYISNDADLLHVLQGPFTTLPSKKSFSLWYSMAPCSRRKLPEMALSMQSDHYFASYVIWEDEKEDARCLAWVRDMMKNVEKHSDGAYLGDSDFQIRQTRFWGVAEGKKLMSIRRERDPRGMICGYLDKDDKAGVSGLRNEHAWLVPEE